MAVPAFQQKNYIKSFYPLNGNLEAYIIWLLKWQSNLTLFQRNNVFHMHMCVGLNPAWGSMGNN